MADLEKVTLADLKQAKKMLEETLAANIVAFEKAYGVKVTSCYYNNYSQDAQIEVKLPLCEAEEM